MNMTSRSITKLFPHGLRHFDSALWTMTTQYSVGLIIPLLRPPDTRNSYSELSIQRLLLFLGRVHAQGIFHLRRGPESDRSPGHYTEAEQGPGFRGERSVGTNDEVGLDTGSVARLGSAYDMVEAETYLHRDIVSDLQLLFCWREVQGIQGVVFKLQMMGCHVANATG